MSGGGVYLFPSTCFRLPVSVYLFPSTRFRLPGLGPGVPSGLARRTNNVHILYETGTETRTGGYMKAIIIYARVSTKSQAVSGLGIEAQIEQCRAWATFKGHTVQEIITDNGVSGTKPPLARPGLGRALGLLADGTADGLVVSKLDRLGRSVLDVLALADTAKHQGWHLAMLDISVDTSNAAGWVVLGMLSVMAEWERRTIAERTSAALQSLKRRGKRLGRPVVQLDAARIRVRDLRASGLSMAATAATLNAEGVMTATKRGLWHGSTVASVERSDRLDAEAAKAKASA